MRSPGDSHEPTPTTDTVLDAYFAEFAQGPEHRLHIAMQVWRSLSPAEQVLRQQEAHEIAGGNLELSAEYTQGVLLLEHVNQRAIAQQTTPESALLETANPAISDGDVSALPPAA